MLMHWSVKTICTLDLYFWEGLGAHLTTEGTLSVAGRGTHLTTEGTLSVAGLGAYHTTEGTLSVANFMKPFFGIIYAAISILP